jgi:hypothetical protein
MSGLALFFHKTAAAAETSSNNNDSLLLRLDEDAAAGITTNTNTKRSGNINSIVTYDTSLVDTIHSNDLVDQTAGESSNNEDAVSWKTHREWKEWQKGVARDFLWERLFENEEEQNDGNEDMEKNNDDDGQQSKVEEQTAAVGGHEADNDDEDDEEKEESAMFETQQETAMVAHYHQHHHAQDEDTDHHHHHHQDENSSIMKQRGTGRISRRPIPCISETLGSVHYVADLDLHSNIADLARLSLDRTWPLRSTTREAIKSQSWHFRPRHNRPLGRFLALLEEQQQQHKQQHKLLALISSCSLWHPGEDDGPLAILYHDVLTMEVHQLLQDDGADSGDTTTPCGSTSLRRRAEAPFLTTTTIANRKRTTHMHRDDGDDVEDCPTVVVVPRRRLKIFVYGTYAKDIETILAIISASSPQGAAKVVFRLRNVPSWCIFPYNNQHHHYNGSLPRSADWYDSHGDVAPYCVCIGDDSMMKYPKESAPSCLTLPPNDTTTASTKTDAKAMRLMRFDHSDLCLHVGLVVTKREGSSLNHQRSVDPKPRRTNIPSQHHDGAAWLVLREWQVTANGLREVAPGKADDDAADSSNDDDLELDINQQQQASGRSVFGEWYSDYQQREQRQQQQDHHQQQQQRQQQHQSTSTSGGCAVAPTVTTNTTTNAADTAATNPETAADNSSRARQETQGQERQTATATTSHMDNDLSRKSTENNADGEAVIVGGSRSLMQSKQNEQVTAAAVAAVSQQTTRSTTGPSNAGAGPLAPTAATGADAGSRRINQGSSSNQGGQGPPINGQHRSEEMPSPRKRQRIMTDYSPLVSLCSKQNTVTSRIVAILQLCLMVNRYNRKTCVEPWTTRRRNRAWCKLIYMAWFSDLDRPALPSVVIG